MNDHSRYECHFRAGKPKANEKVVDWINRQDRRSVYTTSVSLAEILGGIELLPDGRRKILLQQSMAELLKKHIQTPILSFDHAAAISYAAVLKACKKKNHTTTVPDAQIAAIAAVHGFPVATRDVEPFLAAGLRVINPWEDL